MKGDKGMMKKIAMMVAMIVTTLAMSLTAFAGWKQDGSWWWYENSDGSYPANGLYTIGGEQYVFDVNGYMCANKWIEFTDGTWAYCTGSGAIAKNQWIGDYYLGSDGMMATDTWTPDGYYVDENGKWVPGLQRTGNGTLSPIPVGYYNSIGHHGDYESYRVDAWVSINGTEKQINFGHYEATGSPYNYYDNYNPNGDCLVLSEEDGEIYGTSTKDGKKYQVTYNNGTIKIYWRTVTWNSGSAIALDFRDGSASGGVG